MPPPHCARTHTYPFAIAHTPSKTSYQACSAIKMRETTQFSLAGLARRMDTRIQMCNDWIEASLVRMKRSEKQHEEARMSLVKKLREKGIHTLTSAERMDITHYCVPCMYETRSFRTSFYREECVAAFNYQFATFHHRMFPLSHGIIFLTPHIHPTAKEEMKNDIQPLFSALNSTIELSPAPLNLLDLGWDCLNIIGEMVKEENREKWRYW